MRKVKMKNEHDANWQLVPRDDGLHVGKHFATPVPKREPRKDPVGLVYIAAIAAMCAAFVVAGCLLWLT